MAKKATKKSTGSSATRSSAKADSGASGGSDRLVGAVYHNGKMYDPAKRADQEAFKQLVQAEKNQKGEKTDKQGRTIAMLNLQHLADAGALVGYGTKSSAKAKRAAEQADAEDQDEEQNPDAPVGGGIDAVEEQELMEQELEEQEEDR